MHSQKIPTGFTGSTLIMLVAKEMTTIYSVYIGAEQGVTKAYCVAIASEQPLCYHVQQAEPCHRCE